MTSSEAWAARNSVTADLVARKVKAMEEQICTHVPSFPDVFKFVGVQLAIKTKPLGSFDDRSCHVFRNGRVFSVMSGKIDTIFFATERILSLLEGVNSVEPIRASAIRSDILSPTN